MRDLTRRRLRLAGAAAACWVTGAVMMIGMGWTLGSAVEVLDRGGSRGWVGYIVAHAVLMVAWAWVPALVTERLVGLRGLRIREVPVRGHVLALLAGLGTYLAPPLLLAGLLLLLPEMGVSGDAVGTTVAVIAMVYGPAWPPMALLVTRAVLRHARERPSGGPAGAVAGVHGAAKRSPEDPDPQPADPLAAAPA